MKIRVSLLVLSIVSFLIAQQATAQTTQPVTIQFQGRVGNQAFQCDTAYSLGTPATAVKPTDFRFYVSNVALIDAQGRSVPVTLKPDQKWQYQNVALVDFENKSGMCSNGTVETNDRIVGTVPKGTYKGVKFTLGVPFDLNHNDAAIAPSPLNLTSLWWNWRGGYKFARIDFMPAMSASSKHDSPHSPTQKPQNTPSKPQSGFIIHLGSTGCVGGTQKPESCKNPNASTITLSNFNAEKDTIVADIAALVAQTNLAKNQPDTPLGCMSDSKDGDCTAVMRNFGLPWNEQSARQTFFRVAPKQ
ncbi:MAG: metallo-mystery pair system four-Cys motif protein [Leptolyngbya sp. Prado105]|jgi:uncharacterized repeat protein (TIGR04052 family)|nr:metallo-mystery pair system four-Cys motif protein [Leptolyngbya sp. Prado105]